MQRSKPSVNSSPEACMKARRTDSGETEQASGVKANSIPGSEEGACQLEAWQGG
ncbi:MAG TPA: hypothetical protein VFQ91_21820 [Bryobacteraceae bacterium]|nr:hypothetical protein [Bryobacteraceae bacterium]